MEIFSKSLYAILVVFELLNSNELMFSISFLIKSLWLSSCLILVVWEKVQQLKKNIEIMEYVLMFINFKKFESINISISPGTTKPA